MKNLGLSLPLSLRRPKKPVPSQRQPTRPIGEVENGEGFTRKIEVGRAAGFRLANRRLQPLGHLTVREGQVYDRLRFTRNRLSPSLSLKLSLAARKTRRGTASRGPTEALIRR